MANPNLSSRGTHASTAGAKDFEMWDIITNLYSPTQNPTGYISLGIAENSLMHSALRTFLNSKPLIDTSSHALTYGDGPYGSNAVKAVLAAFLTTHLRPADALAASQILVTNGVSAAIEHCAWSLANPGDAILLGRPYYRAFLPDMCMRTGVAVLPVAFGVEDPCSEACVRHYEDAILAARGRGTVVRAIMLCHPHNPLGRCYTRAALLGLMRLCQKYGVHLVSDEIYALSTWENNVDGEVGRGAAEFESVLRVQRDDVIDPGLVHVLWGVSKDFGANGLRLGVIVSPANPALLAACRTCSIYSSPSSLAENAVVALLSDTAFVERYVAENRARLSVAYAIAVRELKKHGIGYMPGANAAFFVWIDLGGFVDGALFLGEGEACDGMERTRLIRGLLMEKKVFLVDGDVVGAEEPGWFRLVFTQREDLVVEGIRRIVGALRPGIGGLSGLSLESAA